MASPSPATVSPELARTTWRAVEPLHVSVYFSPEAPAEYAAIGLEPTVMGYFASRSAAFGAVGAETVVATFFNFNPDVVRSVIPKAWEAAAPEAVLAARLRAAGEGLRRIIGAPVLESEAVGEAAELARTAALEAARHPYGRPLFAAHAGLEWPKEPHLVLWHAQSLLREFRGDGHVAALVTAGLDPVEALVTHAATGQASVKGLRRSRGWSREVWDAAVGRLRERGLVAVGEDETVSLTEDGRRLRREIEDRTDALALPAYAAIGAEGCERLTDLAAPLAQAVNDAGILPGTRRA
ncbi:DNA-binding MarR family transcriptional regulator [Spinactinospora alkalitolerans]|uniref:DNA-binding MarR family transcriptional regulator n=1 Tax=Spinactinospora alkalitolerans TaxID=687207 RepID=A0A852U629_9ACTN|nr:hypothetical protein [Spinactinospora alkalitolerans]NYE49534.1 DNA-binding MarR family transcriptional regulator [Spinactinospora alkalitolerans]